MSRIHPSSENKNGSQRLQDDNRDVVHLPPAAISNSSPKHLTLTVWKRSSMSFQGTDGFTVYDHQGRLAFRVDNYSRNGWSCNSFRAGGSNGGGALVLMDGSGKPLLTLKPQIFSIQNQWNGCLYREDDKGSSKNDKRIFMMRRPFVFGQNKKQAQCEAEVFFNHDHTQPDYRIEGTFWNRDCKIKSAASGEVAAKIMRKRTGTSTMMSNNSSNSSSTIILSEEVFTLMVRPGFDPQLIMAFVVILDRICFKPFFTPLMCS